MANTCKRWPVTHAFVAIRTRLSPPAGPEPFAAGARTDSGAAVGGASMPADLHTHACMECGGASCKNGCGCRERRGAPRTVIARRLARISAARTSSCASEDGVVVQRPSPCRRHDAVSRFSGAARPENRGKVGRRVRRRRRVGGRRSVVFCAAFVARHAAAAAPPRKGARLRVFSDGTWSGLKSTPFHRKSLHKLPRPCVGFLVPVSL